MYLLILFTVLTPFQSHFYRTNNVFFTDGSIVLPNKPDCYTIELTTRPFYSAPPNKRPNQSYHKVKSVVRMAVLTKFLMW